MSFQFPLFLLALLSLLVPILLHLYNNRKHQRISFSHLFFLDRIKVSSKKPSKLQKRILLTARLLLLSLLIFAFAQPFLNQNKKDKEKGLPILFLDQSPSMSLTKDGSSLWDQAQKDAITMLSSMNDDEEVIVLSTTQPMAFQSLLKEEAIKQVKELKVSDQFITPAQLFRYIQSTEEEMAQEPGGVFIFSNFQQSTWEQDSINSNIPNALHLLAYNFETIQNYWVDTAYIVEDEEQTMLNFKVKSHLPADELSSSPLTAQLFINNRLFQTLEIESLSEEGEEQFELPLLQDKSKLQLVLHDPYVNFDDTLYMTYYPQQVLPIALVMDQAVNRFYHVLSQSISQIELEKITTAQLEQAQKQVPFVVFEASRNAAISEQRILKEYVRSGGVVLWMPAYDIQQDALQRLLDEWTDVRVGALNEGEYKVQRMEIQHPIIQEIFKETHVTESLPDVFRYFPMQFKGNQPSRTLFTLRNGDAFINELSIGRGKLYIASVALDTRSTNWGSTYLFAPLMYAMAKQHHFQWPLYLNNDEKHELLVTQTNHQIKEPWHVQAEHTDVIPKQQEWRNGRQIELDAYQLAQGWYTIQQLKDEQNHYEIAYNLAPSFSKLNSMKKEELGLFLPEKTVWTYWSSSDAELPKSFTQTNSKWPLWQWLVGIAILLLLFDTLWTYRDRT